MKRIILVLTILLVTFSVSVADTIRDKAVLQIQTSVTVTSTSTEIIAENLKGRDIFIQNNDTTGIVYINFTGTAIADGTNFRLDPGDSISIPNVVNSVRAIGSIASNANVAVALGI